MTFRVGSGDPSARLNKDCRGEGDEPPTRVSQEEASAFQAGGGLSIW